MAFSYQLIAARGATGGSRPQLVRLSESGLLLGSEWNTFLLGRILHEATGQNLSGTGTEQAASMLHDLMVGHYMREGLRLLGLGRCEGTFLFTLQPSSVLSLGNNTGFSPGNLFKRRWNQREYALDPRRPQALIDGCLKQLEDARLNHMGPLQTLAKCLITIGQMRPGGRISSQLTMST